MFASRTVALSHFVRRIAIRCEYSSCTGLSVDVTKLAPCYSYSMAAMGAVVMAINAAVLDDSASSQCRLQSNQDDENTDSTTTLLNWSGTHAVQVSNAHFWEPETVADVERIIATCHANNQSVRPLGSALSPNGIGFHDGGMMSLAHLDRIVAVDTVAQTVTVQAGARVKEVVEALRPYHLTLPNLASIAEQQMGGFVQVGAHGTGCGIAPVDHYVTQLKIVSPSKGLMTLSEHENGDLFQFAKVGLGCLGVVVEVTMSCIPAHFLREHTFVLTRQEAREQLDGLLQKHKHVRYMWIPFTDAVVCVTNDPSTEKEGFLSREEQKPKLSETERLRPLTDLLMEVTAKSTEPMTLHSIQGMGFGEIRDLLLAVNPLDMNHVKRCNEAEAQFWRKSEGSVLKPSDELLQFDCGGQQWVWEVCFPTGTQEKNNGNDMLFMERLLNGIEEQGIPAHSPIEQRWTASSSSYMSPAHGPPDGLHSWVGIINYLPSENEPQRKAITELFQGPYCDLMRLVGSEVNATSHWAKLEQPNSTWQLVDLQLFLSTRFPVHRFNEWRAKLDPKNILANPLIDLLLGKPA